MRNYLLLFKEATIRVLPPNQKKIIGAFQNGLKARHFNEALAQKSALSLAKVVTIMECYIKGRK